MSGRALLFAQPAIFFLAIEPERRRNLLRKRLTLNIPGRNLLVMRSKYEHNDFIEPSSYRELQILSEIEADPEVNQRQLSLRVGIALGLTNMLLRNLAQKGYVRATKANWRRWLYALTPEGFSHKMRLTTAYVNRVLHHYQKVRQTLREQLEPLALHSESRIAICGTGEFAELVYLGLRELDIEEIVIFGPTKATGQKFLGLPVQDIVELRPEDYDQVVIAELGVVEPISSQFPLSGSDGDRFITFFANGKAREGV